MIETPARAKNVSQPDRNIQFWQKFFSREYIQCSNLPGLPVLGCWFFVFKALVHQGWT